jgi:hypothetical protein
MTFRPVALRFDLLEIEDALAAAVERGVVVQALIAHTNRGGEKRLRNSRPAPSSRSACATVVAP